MEVARCARSTQRAPRLWSDSRWPPAATAPKPAHRGAYESLVRQELDIPLEPSLAALVQSLRSDSSGALIDAMLAGAERRFASIRYAIAAGCGGSAIRESRCRTDGGAIGEGQSPCTFENEAGVAGRVALLAVSLAFSLRTRQHRSPRRPARLPSRYSNRTGDSPRHVRNHGG